MGKYAEVRQKDKLGLVRRKLKLHAEGFAFYSRCIVEKWKLLRQGFMKNFVLGRLNLCFDELEKLKLIIWVNYKSHND